MSDPHAFKFPTFFLLLLTAFGCFKKDERLPPPPVPENVTENMASLGKDYGRQAWFDLETNTFVKIAERGLWDLAFDSRPQKWSIRLNSSKKMRLARLNQTTWENLPTDPSALPLEWRYDESTGNDDSTAYGPLFPFTSLPGPVCLVDLGLSPAGDPLGYAYFQLLQADASTYTVLCAKMPAGPRDTVIIPRHTDYNFVHLSFSGTPHYLLAEPPATSWDLLFTQYTTRVYYEGSTTDFEWYSVNGVLLNPTGTKAARTTTPSFESAGYQEALQASYTTLWDVIGYDWKIYNNSLGAYVIQPDLYFLIHTREGYYFKLRFISFTNPQGERGFPTFRYTKI